MERLLAPAKYSCLLFEIHCEVSYYTSSLNVAYLGNAKREMLISQPTDWEMITQLKLGCALPWLQMSKPVKLGTSQGSSKA